MRGSGTHAELALFQPDHKIKARRRRRKRLVPVLGLTASVLATSINHASAHPRRYNLRRRRLPPDDVPVGDAELPVPTVTPEPEPEKSVTNESVPAPTSTPVGIEAEVKIPEASLNTTVSLSVTGETGPVANGTQTIDPTVEVQGTPLPNVVLSGRLAGKGGFETAEIPDPSSLPPVETLTTDLIPTVQPTTTPVVDPANDAEGEKLETTATPITLPPETDPSLGTQTTSTPSPNASDPVNAPTSILPPVGTTDPTLGIVNLASLPPTPDGTFSTDQYFGTPTALPDVVPPAGIPPNVINTKEPVNAITTPLPLPPDGTDQTLGTPTPLPTVLPPVVIVISTKEPVTTPLPLPPDGTLTTEQTLGTPTPLPAVVPPADIPPNVINTNEPVIPITATLPAGSVTTDPKLEAQVTPTPIAVPEAITPPEIPSPDAKLTSVAVPIAVPEAQSTPLPIVKLAIPTTLPPAVPDPTLSTLNLPIPDFVTNPQPTGTVDPMLGTKNFVDNLELELATATFVPSGTVTTDPTVDDLSREVTLATLPTVTPLPTGTVTTDTTVDGLSREIELATEATPTSLPTGIPPEATIPPTVLPDDLPIDDTPAVPTSTSPPTGTPTVDPTLGASPPPGSTGTSPIVSSPPVVSGTPDPALGAQATPFSVVVLGDPSPAVASSTAVPTDVPPSQEGKPPAEPKTAAATESSPDEDSDPPATTDEPVPASTDLTKPPTLPAAPQSKEVPPVPPPAPPSAGFVYGVSQFLSSALSIPAGDEGTLPTGTLVGLFMAMAAILLIIILSSFCIVRKYRRRKIGPMTDRSSLASSNTSRSGFFFDERDEKKFFANQPKGRMGRFTDKVKNIFGKNGETRPSTTMTQDLTGLESQMPSRIENLQPQGFDDVSKMEEGYFNPEVPATTTWEGSPRALSGVGSVDGTYDDMTEQGYDDVREQSYYEGDVTGQGYDDGDITGEGYDDDGQGYDDPQDTSTERSSTATKTRPLEWRLSGLE